MFLRTTSGKVLGSNSVGDVVQLSISAENLPKFIDLELRDHRVQGGKLAGYELVRAGQSSAHLRLNDFYICAAPGWNAVEFDRKSANQWETFDLINKDEIAAIIEQSEALSKDGALRPASKIWGGTKFVHSDPSLSEVKNAFYVPWSLQGPWGIFTSDGTPVVDAMVGRLIYNIPLDVGITSDDIEFVANDDVYIYGGFFNCHFGHFLVDTLPRYWSKNLFDNNRLKIICHSEEPPKEWFDNPFVARIMGSLGLSHEDFVVLDRPTKIKKLIVPRPALVGQTLIHPVYADMCRRISSVLCGGEKVEATNETVFYSRTKLRMGTLKIINDFDLEEEIRSLGARIVYPEELNFVDQINLMSGAAHIIGTTGSFLHLSAFCQEPRLISALAHASGVASNFHLIDLAAGNVARYMEPVSFDKADPPYGFMGAARLNNVRAVARELMELPTR
ncbi:glycosyltransferase family 61 protein, partial [Methylorubrum sp. Q1]|uniref:glycosyltransferase family 61 protein n=1 Tax=Methylorubrum sp. Q1 TaxID=2562453 RepID=UPI001076A13F